MLLLFTCSYIHCCIGGKDYEPNLRVSTIVMSGIETRKCANVTIIDDQIVEREESFEVTITFPPDQTALEIGEIVPPAMQIIVTVNIIDDDGELEEWNEDIHIIFVLFAHVQCNIDSF